MQYLVYIENLNLPGWKKPIQDIKKRPTLFTSLDEAMAAAERLITNFPAAFEIVDYSTLRVVGRVTR